MKDTQHVMVVKAFFEYASDKYFEGKKEHYLSKASFCDLDFQNEVPEVVCDLLFYLSGYVHHRSDIFTEDAYRQLLVKQMDDISIASEIQKAKYQQLGWQYDQKGIDENIKILTNFSDNYRRDRDAKPTEEENLQSQMRICGDLERLGVPLGSLANVKKNFDLKLKAAIAHK